MFTADDILSAVLLSGDELIRHFILESYRIQYFLREHHVAL